MNEISLVFPHQLFEVPVHLDKARRVVVIEEVLFFTLYPFHQQKIAFARASMRCYSDDLRQKGYTVSYIEAQDEMADIRLFMAAQRAVGVTRFHVVHPTDNWLEKRMKSVVAHDAICWYDSPAFLNKTQDLIEFFKPTKKKFFQTSFYKQERLARNLLMDGGQPQGGQWTYDAENRKKYPKNKIPPQIIWPEATEYHLEAQEYVRQNFQKHYGMLSDQIYYPISFADAKSWFSQFLIHRFHEFGVYEDAIVGKEIFLNHSVLSPLLNSGLLTPEYVVETALTYAAEHAIPINSTEGFIRQIVGWREFIRGVYQAKGTQERTTNFWQHKRAMPQSFYNGTTGLIPFDDAVKKTLKTGYVHHIERLMVMGNLMVLCEIDPDAVYQWFMELFVDAYDWVMVPNVYGMSLFADGGLMSTKPYISGSNYILKMSDYAKGSWQQIWDGLFWRFMDKHYDFFAGNPRLSMLVRNLDRMDPIVKEAHLATAQKFLNQLDEASTNET